MKTVLCEHCREKWVRKYGVVDEDSSDTASFDYGEDYAVFVVDDVCGEAEINDMRFEVTLSRRKVT